jgi:hypothetical protein
LLVLSPTSTGLHLKHFGFVGDNTNKGRKKRPNNHPVMLRNEASCIIDRQ